MWLRCAALASLLAAGCGGAEDPLVVPDDVVDEAVSDASRDDAQVPVDAGSSDATPDASADARPALDAPADRTATDASVDVRADVAADVPPAPSAANLTTLTNTCSPVPGAPRYATDSGEAATISVCSLRGAIFWRSDMDIDCDGGRTSACRVDPSYLPDTSASTSSGAALDAETIPFVVVPLQRTGFSYRALGIQLGSVAAVIYRGRLAYAIFGDEGPSDIIGEGSYALARVLGIDPDPRTGGVDSGVTFIVFAGSSGVVARNEDTAEAARVGASRATQLLREN